MFVSIDFCLIPIGKEVSISPYVGACQIIIEKFGLDYQLGPNGTAIEGEWDEVFECLQSCHQKIHEMGVNRIFSTLKINSSKNKDISFHTKLDKVKRSFL
tara:strand:- start:104 stop:403 length:300 start_codon:yes stop_codon:yes gene_type:complete